MTIDYKQVLLDFMLTLTEVDGHYAVRSQIVGCLQANYPISVSLAPLSHLDRIRGELKRLGAVSLFIREGTRFSHSVSAGKFDSYITCTDHETGVSKSWSTCGDAGTCPYCREFLRGIGPEGD